MNLLVDGNLGAAEWIGWAATRATLGCVVTGFRMAKTGRPCTSVHTLAVCLRALNTLPAFASTGIFAPLYDDLAGQSRSLRSPSLNVKMSNLEDAELLDLLSRGEMKHLYRRARRCLPPRTCRPSPFSYLGAAESIRVNATATASVGAADRRSMAPRPAASFLQLDSDCDRRSLSIHRKLFGC
jgi:hypothetical protein